MKASASGVQQQLEQQAQQQQRRDDLTTTGIQLPSKCRLMVAPWRSLPTVALPNCTKDRRRLAGTTRRFSLVPFSRQKTGERATPSCRVDRVNRHEG
jgi:hypothetical protein